LNSKVSADEVIPIGLIQHTRYLEKKSRGAMAKIKFLLTVFLLTGILQLHAQSFLKVQNTVVVDRDGKEIILRGMGLGGWMLQEGYMLRVRGIGQQQHVIKAKLTELVGEEKTNQFYDAWLANHTRKIDIDSMAAWGFNSVRLAMHYNLYTLPVDHEPIAGQNTWLEKGFAMTDSLLKWCAANKLYLILDLHAAPGGQGNDLNISDRDPSKPSLWQDEANQKKMIALWKRIAQRYVNEPWIGAYDIINEPNWGFQNPDDKNGCGEQLNEPLKKLMVDVTKAIREIDRNHIIIVEGNCWGNNYNNIFPLWDNNMMISFHKYWNYNDKASIQKFIDIREKENAPVWLGESGENSNVWFRDAIHLMETNKIGWAWWPLKKLGFNNPLEVKVPAGYQKILDYWGGDGAAPSREEAAAALDELAANLKLENCIYHKDVIDAMFRQTKTDATIPFNKNEVDKTANIPAIDFDLGRNRYAYSDKDTGNYYISTGGQRTSGNNGRVYRNDGVDLKSDDKGIYVNDVEKTEWLQYTVNTKEKGAYNIDLQVQSDKGASIMIIVNGVPIKPATVTANSSWHSFKLGKFKLKKGENTIRVYGSAGTFNFKALTISKTKS
jgi:endoglucanase